MDHLSFLKKYHRDKLTECDRCGELELYMEQLKSSYHRPELINICSKCEPKVNSFLNYYGKKKKRHVKKLMAHLVSESHQKNKMVAMMNAGYF